MSLYHNKIFNAIIENKAVDKSIKKDRKFYNYLLKNRVAYFYAKFLSDEGNDFEKQIIDYWERRNNLFYKTLEYLNSFCENHNISYVLYKTYKHFWEIIGGDIDIIIKEEDFSFFMKELRKKWWYCIEDEPWKWKCIKKWFITIEPHINISWNGNTFLSPHILFENTEEKYINNKKYNLVNIKYEILSIYLKILYEPEYLDLYDYKILKEFWKNYDFNNIVDSHNINHITWLNKKILSIKTNHVFPYFFSSIKIFNVNLINLYYTGFFNKRMFIHNFYWKYRYIYNWKLPYLTSYIEF